MGLVLLVRHGQASFGAEDYDVLSGPGAEQSRVLGRALAGQGLTPTALVHGAMRRQRDTATAMIEAGGWSVTPELDEGWDEFDHLAVIARSLGESDGHAEPEGREFERLFDEATARWYGGAYDEEYTESWSTFVGRVSGALDRAFARDGVTVVVSSGGPIAVVCAVLLDPSLGPAEVSRLWSRFNTVTANASVTRVLEGSRGRRLLSFNEHLYLPGDLVTYR